MLQKSQIFSKTLAVCSSFFINLPVLFRKNRANFAKVKQFFTFYSKKNFSLLI